MGRPPLEPGTYGKITRAPLQRLKIDGRWTEQSATPETADVWEARCRYRDIDGRTRLVRAQAATGAKAEAALRKKLLDRQHIAQSDTITATTPVSDLLDAWLDTRNQLAPQSREAYQRVIEHDIKPGVGSYRIREVKTSTVDRFLKSIPAETRRKRARLILKGAFDHALRKDALKINPVVGTETTRATKKPTRALTAEELPRFLDQIRTWQQRQRSGPRRGEDLLELITVQIGCGLRIGEVLALRWVDIEPAHLTVAGTITTVGGKIIRQEHPKTERSFRRIPLPTTVRQALDRQREREIAGLVFPSAAGTHRSPRNVSRTLRDARGPFDWVTTHTFRKTASTLVEQAHGLAAASQLLGHSSTVVTEQHYIDRPNLAPDVTDVLDQAIRSVNVR